MLRGAIALLVMLIASPAFGEAPSGLKEAILAVQVNLEAKGERLVLIAEDGDILVAQEDLAALGLADMAGERARVQDRSYLPLAAVPGLTYRLDMERLVLAIQVDPRHLAGRQVLDFGARRSAGVMRPEPAGGFLNYNVTHTRADGSGALDAAGELGMRFGDFLLLGDAYSTEDPLSGERRTTRLSTSLVRDRRDTLERLVVGDFVTVQPAVLGSALRLGGISFSRRFSIDPYYVRFPGQVVTGTATLPSEVFIYSNGVLLRRERIAPGGFELQNLVNLPGLQQTEVVVRDVLGNEQRIVDPYYYSESLLRPGLSEYSFDAGFERRNFGLRSADYGEPGLAGFYRRGMSPSLTLGVHAETLDGRSNAGPSLSWGLGLYGIASFGLAASRSDERTGHAFHLAHAFHSSRWSTSVALRGESRDFARAAPEAPGNRRYDFAASASYALTQGSSVSLGASSSAPWEGPALRSAALGYRMRATRALYLSATARHISGAQRVDELLLTVSWFFDAGGRRNLASLQLGHQDDATRGLVQLSGGNPEREGLLYRVNAERRLDSEASGSVVNPFVQWNAPHAVVRAEAFRDSSSGAERVQLGLQGGVAAVGGAWVLSRPVTDSFAIVKVGELPGVRVYASNQPVGRTDASGIAFVPRLASYFENPLAIEDRDLPLNVIVPRARYVVSPALRSGVFLDFHARAVSAVAGRLVVPGGAPFADAEGALLVEGERRELFTARDGSFYVEQVPAGTYEGEARRGDASCRFRLSVPRSEEVVSDLGEVHCAP